MRGQNRKGVTLALCALLYSCGTGEPSDWDARRDLSRSGLLELRAETRAYDGAPPVIPHDVPDLGRENCLACHTPGSVNNADRIAPPRSHPAWGDCRQCHVEQHDIKAFRRTAFLPLREPERGHRQYSGAPPVTPHSVQNRADCAVCHIGEQAPPALRAAHGPRANCRQCHIAVAGAAP